MISKVFIVFKINELSRSYSKRKNKHFNYLNKAADGEFLDLYLKSFFKEPCILCLERKMKSEMKLNSEHLFEHGTLEMNVISRMQYFF